MRRRQVRGGGRSGFQNFNLEENCRKGRGSKEPRIRNKREEERTVKGAILKRMRNVRRRRGLTICIGVGSLIKERGARKRRRVLRPPQA